MVNDELFITDQEGGYYVNIRSVSKNGRFYPKHNYSILHINIREDLKTIFTEKEYSRYSMDDAYGTIKDRKQLYKICDSEIYGSFKIGAYSYIKVDKKTFTKLKLKL